MNQVYEADQSLYSPQKTLITEESQGQSTSKFRVTERSEVGFQGNAVPDMAAQREQTAEFA